MRHRLTSTDDGNDDRRGRGSGTASGRSTVSEADRTPGAIDASAPPAVDVFLRPDFLSDAECTRLAAEMDRAPHLEGGVRETDRPEADSIDRTGRSAFECAVPDQTVDSIAQRICALAPQLAERFGETLGEYETPHFVVYAPGDFYRPHRDLYSDVAVPDPIARRRVAVVVFLNDALGTSHPGDIEPRGTVERYAGGVLRLCSHEAQEFADRDAWAVPARRGLLVAFRADTWHEVTPITAGRRYTIVALLLAPPG